MREGSIAGHPGPTASFSLSRGDRYQVTIERARAALCARLRRRREEIETAIATRIYAVADPAAVSHPEYAQGLRASLTSAVEYGLASIESGERRSPPLPPTLAAHARVAARCDVGLDTVLRRYITGYTLLIEYAIDEAEVSGLLREIGLGQLLRGQGALCDRLVAEVSTAYLLEASRRFSSNERRRAERVRRLLSGELLDTSDLGYGLDAWHIGAIASGPGATLTLRRWASSVDANLLLVCPEPETVWAWLGSRQPLNGAEIEGFSRSVLPSQLAMALGEQAEGPAGWRLTHRQSLAALPIALRGSRNPVRYAGVALLTSMLSDDLLTTSLRELFLAPLEHERDGGRVLFETLRIYFSADRKVSSAAAALGVTRRTVANRLRTVETRLGCSLRSVASEMEAALQLRSLQVEVGNDPSVPTPD